MARGQVLRWRALVVLVVAAVLSATLPVAQRTPAEAAPVVDRQTHGQPAGHRSMNPRQVAFHDQMRRLWTDHVVWTRLAIVTFAEGTAGFDTTAGRLLRNQTDIGDAFKRYYGTAVGNRLTTLLREHILIAVELLQAAKAGDTAAFEAARARWYHNANEVADFLASINPRFWSRTELRAAMRTHLDQTLTEASHELAADYAASVADYDEIQSHILHMADLLSVGIMAQFPHRFR